jgi:hypothetical protein
MLFGLVVFYFSKQIPLFAPAPRGAISDEANKILKAWQ